MGLACLAKQICKLLCELGIALGIVQGIAPSSLLVWDQRM
jgi:hypothetical protein